MASETQAQAIGEMLAWLEQQLRETRDGQGKTEMLVDHLRKQLYELGEQQTINERLIREVEPRFVPFRGIPEKIRSLDESSEHIRQQISANKADIDNALKLVRAEADYDRAERAEAFKRIESTASQLGLIAADTSQVQAQTSQISQTAASLLERQREVEAQIKQFGLRLDRAIEVNKDVEARLKSNLAMDIDDRFEVVFERLQVVGEMVKRNESLIEAATAEQTLREEVLDELSVWREQHGRLEARVNALEETSDRALTELDKLRGEIALLEGRHAGLGERVQGIRRDISEVVDGVRAEFIKFNALLEKQRKKQIQVLEQELREMKFHGFRPPEEP